MRSSDVANGRQRGGFNPDRMADLTRSVQVVPQIMEAPHESQARGFTEVKIIGVGGGGSNAVNRMIEAGVQGVDFVAVNTDAQALQMSAAVHKLPIGGRSTKGLGTGSGAAPIIADIARHARALTVGVVTLPFTFEGYRRRKTAEAALERLREH